MQISYQEAPAKSVREERHDTLALLFEGAAILVPLETPTWQVNNALGRILQEQGLVDRSSGIDAGCSYGSQKKSFSCKIVQWCLVACCQGALWQPGQQSVTLDGSRHMWC